MVVAADIDAVRAALARERERPVEAYAIDRVVPALALRPRDRLEVARALEAAARGGLVVVPQGARTALRLGRPLERYDVALDLGGLDRIVAYEPEDLTCTVEAGVSLEALRARLAEHGQDFAIDPPPGDEVSIGGLLATARPGAWRGHLPSARDLVLGATVALPEGPEGTLATSGGRVVKNVSGYDLHRLHAGALGAFGVIVEASFKLAPLPASRRTLALRCSDLRQASDVAFEVWDRTLAVRAISLLAPAASRVAGLPEAAHVLVEAAGGAAAVERTLRDLDALASTYGASIEETGGGPWVRLRRLAGGDDEAGDVVLRLGVPPSELADATEAASETGAVAWGHLAAGSVLVQAAALDAAWVRGLRARVEAMGGFLAIEAAPAALRLEVEPQPSAERELVRALKRQLDPERVINRGRWAEDV